MGHYRSPATIKHKDFEIKINIVKMPGALFTLHHANVFNIFQLG